MARYCAIDGIHLVGDVAHLLADAVGRNLQRTDLRGMCAECGVVGCDGGTDAVQVSAQGTDL